MNESVVILMILFVIPIPLMVLMIAMFERSAYYGGDYPSPWRRPRQVV